jgi:hypothetical protein
MAYIDRNDSIDEMSIVDIFTKLIFDAECPLGDREQMVIAVLVDLVPSLRNASRRDLSEYLRAMSVDEMITAVDQIKDNTARQQELVAAKQMHQGHHLAR